VKFVFPSVTVPEATAVRNVPDECALYLKLGDLKCSWNLSAVIVSPTPVHARPTFTWNGVLETKSNNSSSAFQAGRVETINPKLVRCQRGFTEGRPELHPRAVVERIDEDGC
jgi:hypothetical protein